MKYRTKLIFNDEHIVKLYVVDKVTQNEIAKMCGCSSRTIKTRLVNNNVKLRNSTETHSIYTLNETYFESIDSHEKAYWLGFIYADGNLRRTSSSVIINLALKDKEHLNKFRVAVGSDAPIKDYYVKLKGKKYPAVTLRITNKHFRKTLEKLGLTPNKSKTLQFPDKLGLGEFMSSFMLGYFDGDGSIRNKNGKEQFSITSNMIFLEMYDAYLKNILSLKGDHVYKKSKKSDPLIGRLEIGGNQQISKIYNFLYGNCSVFLERKHDIIKDIHDKAVNNLSVRLSKRKNIDFRLR